MIVFLDRLGKAEVMSMSILQIHMLEVPVLDKRAPDAAAVGLIERPVVCVPMASSNRQRWRYGGCLRAAMVHK